jgi:mxaL protein
MKPWQRVRLGFRRQREAWLLGGAALALALGFLQPTVPWKRGLFEQIVVIDVTQSMNVTDQRLEGKPVSRLAFAKHALRQTLSALPCGSKIGWALFTEHRSYLLFAPVEVCEHLDELRATLDAIDNRMAWIGGSEVAKGLHSGLSIARQLPDTPAMVFVTDGHEAPPLNPRHRPAFDDTPGAVPGVVVGVGGSLPSPIPKLDPSGRPLGFWRADEVMQHDLRSQGRGASVSDERLADDGNGPPAPTSAALGVTPGSEHLSALREAYLRLLASEAGLAFHRLDTVEGLTAAMTAPALSRRVAVRADARVVLSLLALVLLLWRYVPIRHQDRSGAARPGKSQGSDRSDGPDGPDGSVGSHNWHAPPTVTTPAVTTTSVTSMAREAREALRT